MRLHVYFFRNLDATRFIGETPTAYHPQGPTFAATYRGRTYLVTVEVPAMSDNTQRPNTDVIERVITEAAQFEGVVKEALS